MGSMPAPQLPPLPTLAPEKHRWEQSKTNPRQWQRRGVGSEVIVGCERMNVTGQYDLYLIQNLRIANTSQPITMAYLKEKLALALYDARFEHPECGFTVSWDDAVGPLFHYENPESKEDVLKWVDEAIHVEMTPKSGRQVWYDIESKRQKLAPKVSKAVDVHLIANPATDDTPLLPGTTIEILSHTNHLFWDGIGARIFTGFLLKRLAKYLGLPAGQATADLAWGEERANICPLSLDAMKVNVEELGDKFQARCQEYMKALMDNYGGLGIPITHSEQRVARGEILDFTVEESKAMIEAVKTRLGPDFTLTHLCQAAIIAAMVNTWTPEGLTDNDPFVGPMAGNARKFLKEDMLQGHHIGYCVTGAVIRIDNIKRLIVGLEDEHRGKLVEALGSASRDVKKSIDYWLSDPVQIATTFVIFTFEGTFIANNPLPYQKTSAPFLSSDGMIDKYIPTEVKSDVTGETFMTTEKSNFLLNQYLPYVAFRLESFRGASSLNICYNEPNFSQKDMTSFLKKIADYMLAFRL